MAHFVLVKNNVVTDLMVVDNAQCQDLEYPASEPVGRAYLNRIGFPGEWMQTSYTGAFRGVYAGPGFTYDPKADKFIRPKVAE